MNGYYDSNAKGRGQKVPTGRLRISVTNIPEFKDLIMKANREADQLRETIRQLESFYLGVDFDIWEKPEGIAIPDHVEPASDH